MLKAVKEAESAERTDLLEHEARENEALAGIVANNTREHDDMRTEFRDGLKQVNQSLMKLLIQNNGTDK